MEMVCLRTAVQPTHSKSRSSKGKANEDGADADNSWTGQEVIKSM